MHIKYYFYPWLECSSEYIFAELFSDGPECTKWWFCCFVFPFIRTIHLVRVEFQEFSFASVKIDVTDGTCIEIKEIVTRIRMTEQMVAYILCIEYVFTMNVTKIVCRRNALITYIRIRHWWTIHFDFARNFPSFFGFVFYFTWYKFKRDGVFISNGRTSTADEMWTTPNACARSFGLLFFFSLQISEIGWRQSDSMLFDFEFSVFSLPSGNITYSVKASNLITVLHELKRQRL